MNMHIGECVSHDTLPHCPGRDPIFHQGAPRCHWGATPVTGVRWIDHRISWGAPKPRRKAKLGRGGNFSTKILLVCTPRALKGVVTIFQNSTGLGTNYLYSWGLGSITSGLHYFPKISLGCTPIHPGAPRCTPGRGSEVGSDMDTWTHTHTHTHTHTQTE